MDSQYLELSEQYATKPSDYYEWPRLEMIPFVPKSSRTILDVGCSSGAFGAALKNAVPGCEVWGIEPDSQSANVAATRLDFVVNGTLSGDMAELKNKRFDCIVFNDVLEHLVNPEKALLDCKKYLSESGVVVASIPNILHFYQIMRILVHRDWQYEEFGILDNTHLRFFTKKSIIRLFNTCGFNVEVISGINPFTDIRFWIANMITLGFVRDWKYVQFGVRARITS